MRAQEMAKSATGRRHTAVIAAVAVVLSALTLLFRTPELMVVVLLICLVWWYLVIWTLSVRASDRRAQRRDMAEFDRRVATLADLDTRVIALSGETAQVSNTVDHLARVGLGVWSGRGAASAEMAAQPFRHFATADEVEGYRNIFARGYLITNSAAPHQVPEHWTQLSFGDWQLSHDRELRVDFASDQAIAVVIIGDAVDTSFVDRGRAVTAHQARQLLTRSFDALEAELTWWSGRYLVLARLGDQLRVYGDAMGSRTCYWHQADSRVLLASHTALIADQVGGLSWHRARQVITSPDYVSPAGKTLPGTIEPHDDVLAVLANHYLAVTGNQVRHERFFPREPLAPMSLPDATAQFRHEMRSLVGYWGATSQYLVHALTAGYDSRAVLNSCLDQFHDHAALTMTYHFFATNAEHSYVDLLRANRVAVEAGLPHLVLPLVPMAADDPFRKLYQRTFPTWSRFANLASACYHHLPAKSVLLVGTGAAIGTVMHADRTQETITPERLAWHYTPSKFNSDPNTVAAMAEFIDYAQFDLDLMHGYDYRDLFHWEHRISRWAAVGFSEFDFSVQASSPFASRRLLTAMLALPESDRRAKTLYRELGRLFETPPPPGATSKR